MNKNVLMWPMSAARPRGRHAVVIGGSMAGLLAARVLADEFETVTVLERDGLPAAPGPRKGVPQARHAHVLLQRGQLLLERLFPGLAHDLAAAGAPVVDAAGDLAWLTPAGWAARFRSGIPMLAASRDLLEWSVRRRVAALPGVRFVEEVDVTGLIPDPAGDGIIGVWVRRRKPAEGQPAEERLEADLVVDASGRGSRAPQWLEGLGYGRVEETVVKSHLGYASRLYERPDGADADWKALYVQAKGSGSTRGGLIVPTEGGRWMVTLSGRGGEQPPTDEAGFLEFARSLHSPELYRALKDAKPLSSIVGFRGAENRLRHFERMKRWPERFVVLGDAACAFNPVYGQGMTTAALAAIALGECLSRRRHGNLVGLARRFQRELAKVTSVPWLLATGEDFRYDTARARPGWGTRLKHWYFDQVMRLSTKDAGARRLFLEVTHLLKTPAALFSPAMMLGVVRQLFADGPPSPPASAPRVTMVKQTLSAV